MIHFTIFGGTEAQLNPNTRVSLTLFGGTELKSPTLARKILHSKRQSRSEPYGGKFSMRNRCLVVTVFGATEVKCPTLAEEFLDLKALLASEQIDASEWDRAVTRLSEEGSDVDFITLTLFGGFGLEYPSKSSELERIDKHADLGLITQREQNALSELAEYDPRDARTMLTQMATNA